MTTIIGRKQYKAYILSNSYDAIAINSINNSKEPNDDKHRFINKTNLHYIISLCVHEVVLESGIVWIVSFFMISSCFHNFIRMDIKLCCVKILVDTLHHVESILYCIWIYKWLVIFNVFLRRQMNGTLPDHLLLNLQFSVWFLLLNLQFSVWFLLLNLQFSVWFLLLNLQFSLWFLLLNL
jgi:hypothetical protein